MAQHTSMSWAALQYMQCRATLQSRFNTSCQVVVTSSLHHDKATAGVPLQCKEAAAQVHRLTRAEHELQYAEALIWEGLDLPRDLWPICAPQQHLSAPDSCSHPQCLHL